MRRRTIIQVSVGLVALFVLLAWIDGGREPQRMIEQPVVLERQQ
ncbi:hypothetical protein [Croceibacterium ferulae]|nr:hypothetical protein [Croceibacterium ferulae]